MKDHMDEQPAIFLLDINVHQLLYIGESPFKIWENRVTTAGGKKRVEINYFNYGDSSDSCEVHWPYIFTISIKTRYCLCHGVQYTIQTVYYTDSKKN